MLGEEDEDQIAGGTRKTYLRSASWSDRSPRKQNPRSQPNSKVRSCLPPLQPLSIAPRNVDEWPKAGSDDLGVWPNLQSPSLPFTPSGNVNLEEDWKGMQFKKDKLAFFEKECSRIADHVYVGSDYVAKNRDVLRQNGITHVLNCVGFVSHEYFKDELVYKTLWLQDNPSEDIMSVFYDVFDYFEEVRELGGRVFVHCFQGVSRSTSLVIAYLMWREGQSFEDAFQYVKAARGVTNPNLGFACQLLQCQKRMHALPASPNSMLRMYRMAPHSPYDPLHLVPKMLSHPGEQVLDSRGAFIVQVPFAIYVWAGKSCNSSMLNDACAAALQVIKYERAQGPFASITEGEEPSKFWDALATGQFGVDGSDELKLKIEENFSSGTNEVSAAVHAKANRRKVDEYDADYEIFQKAFIGGVVAPFPLSTRRELSTPTRENKWKMLRQKFANGIVKEMVKNGFVRVNDGSGVNIDNCNKEDFDISTPSSPLTSPSDVPHSFSSFHDNSSSDSETDILKPSRLNSEPLSPASCGSPDSFSCFLSRSPDSSSKSPSLSPSTSDYSSSFTFSPSSNWSDLSSRQLSPSGLEHRDMFSVKNASVAYNSSHQKDTSLSASDTCSADKALSGENDFSQCNEACTSIAERRGSNLPSRMLLPPVDELTQGPKYLIRSWSFSLYNLDDDVKDTNFDRYESVVNKEDITSDPNITRASSQLQSKFKDRKEGNPEVRAPDVYKWPTLEKVEMHHSHSFDSRHAYVVLAPDNPCAVCVWVGREVSDKEAQSQLISYNAMYRESNFCWEMVGHDFLHRMGGATSQYVQIVRDGKEPEQFLSNVNYFSFQKWRTDANLKMG